MHVFFFFVFMCAHVYMYIYVYIYIYIRLPRVPRLIWVGWLGRWDLKPGGKD